MTLDQMLNDLTGKIDRTRAAGRTSGTFSIDELEQLTFEVDRLRATAKDDAHSLQHADVALELSHKASAALRKAWLKAHPEWPGEIEPGIATVNIWAAQQLGLKPEELESERGAESGERQDENGNTVGLK